MDPRLVAELEQSFDDGGDSLKTNGHTNTTNHDNGNGNKGNNGQATAATRGRSRSLADLAVRNHIHHTWARTFSSIPELYFQPTTLPEITRIVNLARKWRRRLVVTGCGHSPSNMTCTSNWLLNLDKFNRVLYSDSESGVVIMQSGIRLYDLCSHLDAHGLAMPNLGSINEQSIAGAISTGTHGSSIYHGLMSSDVLALKIMLADGTTHYCSAPEYGNENPRLYRAGLLSLGALGIITEVTFRAVPAFSLAWKQVIDSDRVMLDSWARGDLWTRSEFVRAWWFPYTRRAVVWEADKTGDPQATPHRDPPLRNYDGPLGYYLYHNLLYLAQWVPRALPWVEWLVFGLQYGFANGSSVDAVQPSRKALLMNCLYSQFVNEWAIPLHKGPEAIRRLSSWLNQLGPEDPDYVPHGIPFSAKGLYVHAPLEVRVSDTSTGEGAADARRPYLDPTLSNGPTLYLNATLYRPYHADPPCRERYYEAFEWLMMDLGGRPHWAKNFDTTAGDIEDMFGHGLVEWRGVRDEVDPAGMFVGPWHREKVLGGVGSRELDEKLVEIEKEEGAGDGSCLSDHHDGDVRLKDVVAFKERTENKLPLEEVEVARRPLRSGGLRVTGRVEESAI